MNEFSYNIHGFLRESRKVGFESGAPAPAHEEVPTAQTFKEYPRMPRIALSEPLSLTTSLQQSFLRRKSDRTLVSSLLSLVTLSTLLHPLGVRTQGGRAYPSGGGLYPIETYLIAQNIEGLDRGAYHYHPPSHSLEHLWNVPATLGLFSGINEWAEQSRAILMFTGIWERNSKKYKDFGYLLGILENGHIAQNVLLTATALEIPACALAGFDDVVATELLDLKNRSEQPVYAIAFG